MDPVVLDHGSDVLKAGYANPDSDPSVLLPSSFCLSPGPLRAGESRASLAVPRQRDLLHVLDGGRVADWDILEDAWQHVLYDQLGWEEGHEGHVFVAEPILTPRVDREKMAQVLFEKFNVSGFFALEAPVLSLYSMGRLTGCCVDVGHTKTDIAAVSDGALIPSSACRWEAGGWDLEAVLGQLLAQSNPAHRALLLRPGEQPAPAPLLRQLKERFCRAAPDPAALDSRDVEPERFLLPDGQALEVSGEGLLAGEALFRPQAVGREATGLCDLLLQSVTDAAAMIGAGGAESDRVRTLLENIALVGGVSAMPGFSERFLWEMGSTLPPLLRPSMMKAPEYMPENTAKYSNWIGGAIIAKIVFAQNQHVSRGEYDEKGPAAVSKKLV